MAADRFARAAVRVALRQLRVVERTSPALVAWLSTHDRLEPGELNNSIGDHPCTAIRSGGEDVVMPIDLEKWCRQKEIARAGVAGNSPFPFIPTCCGTHAGSPTTATTLAASRPISGTAVLVENFDLLNLANLSNL